MRKFKNLYRNKCKRNKRGASLALVVVCACLLVFCVYASFQLALILGGVQELNSTADAAALNIAKRSMQIKTSPQITQYGYIYSDCADSTGNFSLANMNRVWGKAYLINANVEEMMANQQLSNQATDSANQAYQAAQAINNDLQARLQDPQTLGSFFDQIAGGRLHRMLGNAKVSSSSDSDWATALAFRGSESNLTVNPNQIPAPANGHFSSISNNKQNFMQGYTPMEANEKTFYFIPFPNGEMPHLVSEIYFKQNRADVEGISQVNNPLPNAFSGHGTAENSISAHSFAVANPQRQYNLAMPHAFVSINITNIAYWIVQGKQVNMTTYGFTPVTQWGAHNIPLGNAQPPTAFLNGYASLGNEYQSNMSVWTALNSFGTSPSQVLTSALQKIQEVKPDFTQANLQQLLQQQQLINNVNNYLIYPTYTSADNTNPSIQITPLSQQTMKTLPKWINVIAANEGQAKILHNQNSTQDEPNYDWEVVVGSGFQASNHWTQVGGSINWQPGTGFNQTLGRLTAVHTTHCYFTAQ